MQQEFTTHQHVGSDGVLHLAAMNVPTALQNEKVKVKLTLEVEAESTETSAPAQNLAEALEGYVGTVSFDVPEDFHERRKEIYVESLAEKYEHKTQ